MECKKWWWQTPELESKSNLFDFEPKGDRSGISPLSVGVIVTVKDPRSEVYFDPGSGIASTAGGGHKRIFNHVYGTGDYTACVTVRRVRRNEKKEWQTKKFQVHVDPRPFNGIIKNFFQGKAAGQYATGATGLDVDFSIALDITPKAIEWFFEPGSPILREEGPKAKTLMSVDHIYKNIGTWKGYVKVTDQDGKTDPPTEFEVVIAGLD